MSDRERSTRAGFSRNWVRSAGVWAAVGVLSWAGCVESARNTDKGTETRQRRLLNVSYDPTREFYLEFNQAFAAHWLATQGERVTIDQSHGGSGKQARAVSEGLAADVVSLALSGDIDGIARQAKLLPNDWQSRFPHNSSPYTSTIVFLVRKGNPKGVRDWGDLTQGELEIITPNPKTGGGARWNYLAAWGYALHRELGDLRAVRDPAKREEVLAAEVQARAFVTELYRRVPVLDASARAATNTFLQRRIGDVLLTWENEAYLALREFGADEVEVVVPSISILAEPPVAVVATNVQSHGTEDLAAAYLEYLYSDVGQRIVAKHHYRPRMAAASEGKRFAELQLFSLTELVSGWDEAQQTHFRDRDGIFDQIFQSR